MVLNEFDVVVATETETQIIQDIKDAAGPLDFLKDLSPEERRRYAKMSVSKQDFIDKTLIHGEQHPDVFPQYTNLDSFRKSMMLIKCMERINAQLKPFSEKLQDTILLARSEAFEVARAFYSSVKEAARHGVPEMEHILKDLSFHFRKNGPVVKSKASGKANNTDSVENSGNNEQSAN